MNEEKMIQKMGEKTKRIAVGHVIKVTHEVVINCDWSYIYNSTRVCC